MSDNCFYMIRDLKKQKFNMRNPEVNSAAAPLYSIAVKR